MVSLIDLIEGMLWLGLWCIVWLVKTDSYYTLRDFFKQLETFAQLKLLFYHVNGSENCHVHGQLVEKQDLHQASICCQIIRDFQTARHNIYKSIFTIRFMKIPSVKKPH